jgi:hypothetical protein
MITGVTTLINDAIKCLRIKLDILATFLTILYYSHSFLVVVNSRAAGGKEKDERRKNARGNHSRMLIPSFFIKSAFLL